MTNFKPVGTICALVVLIAGSVVAGAQSRRHDIMDARAAERDIDRLMVERSQARAAHNWGKVRQDNRLMRADWKWVSRDYRRAHRRYYPFR
jgi:hypothetical protein